MRLTRTITGAVIVAGLTTVLAGQQPAFKRTELQRGDLSIPGRECVQAVAELPPGVGSGMHTHPGEEFAYVLDGTVLVELEGQPARTLKAGDSFNVKAGQVHGATNKGDGFAKILGTYIVEKGKPLGTPVK